MTPGRLITPPLPQGPKLSGAVPSGPVYILPDWLLNWFRPVPPPAPLPPKPAPAPVPPPTPPPESVSIVAALSAERKGRGLAALAYDLPVAGVAQYWANYQSVHNEMTHGPGTSFAQRIWTVRPGTYVGEVVAEGAKTIPDVVALWLASPEHKAIILGNFTTAGAGLAYSADGTPFYCVDFVR